MPSETLTITDGYWVAGADSMTVPDKLGPGEIVAGMNVTVRGGVAQTRPGSTTLLSLPGDEWQGFTTFTPANGVPHLVGVVGGYVYVSEAPFAEYRRLPDIRFSPTSKFVAMESCLKSTDYTADGELIFINKPYNVLVMQDGATRAAFWDGSISRHLNPTPASLTDEDGERITQNGFDETFIGLWMKWSGNRLWVSRDGMLFASDIGNPLKFTEAQYINEGRAFYLPGECTGMIETPEQDGLIVFTIDNGTLFQTSIQDRTKWLETPNFQKIVFSNIGCASPLSLVKQYGLIWWFSPMGLINSDQAFNLNRSSRIDIQDNEMMCSKGNIGPDISGICTCSYENYLLCSVPSGDVYNRHTWCLDQAVFEGPLNAWNSYWTGWRPFQWAVGNVNGVQRVFFASKDYNGCLKIWEANIPDRKDNGSPVTCFAQFRQNDFGRANQLKRFTYAEVNLQEILGDVSLMVAVGGRKGGYTRVLTKEIAATEGAIYGDSIYDINTCMYGHRPQTRIVRTQENVSPSLCNRGGIEGPQPNDVDITFGLLVVWSGRMGVAGYLAQSIVYEDQAAGNCEDDEINPNSLSEQGCADKNFFINTCSFPIINGSGSAEAYCPRSAANISAVSTSTSIISQADADRKAYWSAYIEAEQQCRNCLDTIYRNTQQRYTASCPAGSEGESVTITIPEGVYSSTVSQAAANAQALSAAKIQAISELSCLFYNTPQEYTASCPPGFEGDPVTVDVSAGEFSSPTSQEEANAEALAFAQQEAESQLVCTPAAVGSLRLGDVSQGWAYGSNISAYAFGDFTWEFWGKYDVLGSDTLGMATTGGLGPFGSTYVAQAFPPGGITILINGNGGFNPRIVVSMGEWVHYCFVRSGTSIKGFRNGVEVASDTTVGTIVNISNPAFSVGYQLTGSELLISELRLWNVARTSGEIAASYNTRIDPVPPQLVAYWQFKTEPSLYEDISINGNDLTSMGDAGFSNDGPPLI